MMLKVCMIIYTELALPAVKGGAIETLVDSILDKTNVNQDIDMTVVAPFNDEAEKESRKNNNINYIFCKWVGIISNKTNHLLRKIIGCNIKFIIWQLFVFYKLRNKEFDVVIVESNPLRVLYRYKILRKNFIRTKSFLFHMHWNENITKKMCDIYDGFLAISPYVYKKILEKVDKEKIFLLNNCIDINKFKLKLSDNDIIKEKEKYNILKEKVVFLFCGRICSDKGVIELISAFKNMKYKNNSVLLVAGNMNEEDSYTKKLYENSLGENIIFTGYIPNDNLYKLHNIADVTIVPSVWEEPMGLVVLEGLASGNAMIVSDSGSIPDFVSNDCAITVKRGCNFVRDLSKALDYLYENPNIRYKMGENGIKFAESYNQDAYYSNFLAGMRYFSKHNN